MGIPCLSGAWPQQKWKRWLEVRFSPVRDSRDCPEDKTRPGLQWAPTPFPHPGQLCDFGPVTLLLWSVFPLLQNEGDRKNMLGHT